MILIDSSVWISYYRPNAKEKLIGILKEIILADLAAINGIIMTEVLSGISKDKEYNMVLSDFMGLHYLEMIEDVFIKASALGTLIRKKGMTVPPTDLIIAASAINSGCTLYHMDSQFDAITNNAPLKAKNLLTIL
jgi:predicted nucleic acid-binding protein